MQISKNPPRGTYDLFPEEYAVRKYIFDTWRRVCTNFGYQEYLGPIVESADIWRAKSGEDVGGSELTLITDRTGAPSELALRPEMTPTVTRMVCKIYNETPKPIRYFSIANFYRNERPQRGRNREFWQLNFDLFGSDSLYADVEILQLAIVLLLAFDAPENSFRMSLGNRKIINFFLEEVLSLSEDKRKQVVRTMDKWKKLPRETFEETLRTAEIPEDGISKVVSFMTSGNLEELAKNFPAMTETDGYKELLTVFEKLDALGYGKYVSFDPSLIRGFDYYDGMIFEIFDLNPENTRSMFGGGRYNGLASIFGEKSFPAVGSGPGDETFRLFLEGWNLIEPIRTLTAKAVYYVPLLADELYGDVQAISSSLRAEGKVVETGVEVTAIRKAFEYANKRKLSYVVIYGTDEQGRGIYKLKDLESGDEKEVSMEVRSKITAE